MKRLCCQEEKNLYEVETRRADFKHLRCAVCGANHYRVTARPATLGVKGGVLRTPPEGAKR